MDDEDENESDLTLDKILLRTESGFKKYKEYLIDFGYYIRTSIEKDVSMMTDFSEPTPSKDLERAYASHKAIPMYFGAV